jgi:hypothetical protein
MGRREGVWCGLFRDGIFRRLAWAAAWSERVPRNRILQVLVGTAWAVGVAFGLCRLWGYENSAGEPAAPPKVWPDGTSISRVNGLPTLVLLIHPHCPCSRASIDELAKLMTECQGKISTTVLMLRPNGATVGWERTDLWDSAAAIPGVSVRADISGIEARRFGAATSGQALLFAPDGRLVFAGGITESRGHSGDNAGRSAIAALIAENGSMPSREVCTPVYGCPLFDRSSSCQKEGLAACRRQ